MHKTTFIIKTNQYHNIGILILLLIKFYGAINKIIIISLFDNYKIYGTR